MAKQQRHRYMRRHGSGDQWFFQRAVPKDLRDVLGKKCITESLQTDSTKLAEKRRDERLAFWNRQFDQIRRVDSPDKNELQRIFLEGAAWARRHLEFNAEHGANDLNDALFCEFGVHMYNDTDMLEPEDEAKIDGVLNEIERFRLGQPSLPPQPASVAVSEYLERWLDECDVTARTKLQGRKAVNDLAAWTGSDASLSKIDRKKAGEYISETFIAAKAHPVTANEKIGALSLYWRWLIKRGHAEVDPWSGQRLKQPKKSKANSKRPYTDQELATILEGDPGQPLSDIIQISALSGMRLEEVCLLTVADCNEGIFRITKAKTSAGVREVPIHSALADIVQSRCCADGAYLIHELNDPPSDTMQRSHEMSKRFTRYRRGLGIDERPDGQRQSNVDFHSLRRWFIASARDAWTCPAKVEGLSDSVERNRRTLWANENAEHLRKISSAKRFV